MPGTRTRSPAIVTSPRSDLRDMAQFFFAEGRRATHRNERDADGWLGGDGVDVDEVAERGARVLAHDAIHLDDGVARNGRPRHAGIVGVGIVGPGMDARDGGPLALNHDDIIIVAAERGQRGGSDKGRAARNEDALRDGHLQCRAGTHGMICRAHSALFTLAHGSTLQVWARNCDDYTGCVSRANASIPDSPRVRVAARNAARNAAVTRIAYHWREIPRYPCVKESINADAQRECRYARNDTPR